VLATPQSADKALNALEMNVQCGYVDGGLIHWPTQADEVRLGSCMLRQAIIWLWLAACDTVVLLCSTTTN
jgi:diketogulonate reductase-like aldo/keto reductase